MPKNDVNFTRISIEAADNGFVVNIEGNEEDKTLVYSTARQALHDLRLIMNGKELEE